MSNKLLEEYATKCTAHGVSHLWTDNKGQKIFWTIFMIVALLAFGIDKGQMMRTNSHSLWKVVLKKGMSTFGFIAIVQCFYDDQKCSFTNFTQVWFPYYHHCHQFLPTPSNVRHQGENGGLSLIMYGNDRRGYLTDQERLNWFPGFHLSLGTAGTFPSLLNAVSIPTGYSTTVSFKIKQYRKSKYGPHTCVNPGSTIRFSYHDENGDYLEPHIYDYSDEACRIVNNQRFLERKCKCYNDQYPIPIQERLDNRKPTFSAPLHYAFWLGSNAIHWCHYVADGSLLINRGYKRINSTHVRIDGKRKRLVSIDDPIFKQLRAKHDCMGHVEDSIVSKKPARSTCEKSCESTEYSVQSSRIIWPSKLSYGTYDILVLSDTSSFSIFKAGEIEVSLREAIKHAEKLGIDNAAVKLFNESKSMIGWTDNIDDLRINFGLVKVFATSTDVLFIDEDMAYPIGNLLSGTDLAGGLYENIGLDFGGTLGLWVGCSVISIMELICLFYSLCIIQRPRK